MTQFIHYSPDVETQNSNHKTNIEYMET